VTQVNIFEGSFILYKSLLVIFQSVDATLDYKL